MTTRSHVDFSFLAAQTAPDDSRVLQDVEQLAAALHDGDHRHVTVHAPWTALSSGLLSTLAEWAAEDAQRGCGVRLLDSPRTNVEAPPSATDACAPWALLIDDAGTQTFAGTTAKPVELNDALSRLSEETPPAALVVTGHGGEHCITLGDRWLASHDEVGLPPPLVYPHDVRAGAVFLNTCGSLRLGDSVVPERLSLAASLYRRGIPVVGAFRNQFGFAEAPRLFASLVLEGHSMGRVVNALNRESLRRGNPFPAYQLLGAANARPVQGELVPPAPAPLPPAPVVELNIEGLLGVDHLVRTLETWLDPGELPPDPLFEKLLRTAMRASHGARRGVLRAEDAQTLATYGRDAARERQQAIVRVLAARTRQGKWPQELYAAYSKPARFVIDQCPRCGGRMMSHVFSPLRASLLSVSSNECDGCGTIRDIIGEAPSVPNVQLDVVDDELLVRVTPLDDESVGLVSVYRARDLPSQPWPREGGTLRFDRARIPFVGKTTVCATRLSPSHLLYDYATRFISSTGSSASS